MTEVTQEEIDRLREQYLETVKKMYDVMPTLLAMLDFRKEKNMTIVAQRLKDGIYGTVEGGSFISPKTGPYQNFLGDMKISDLENLREIFFHHEKK